MTESEFVYPRYGERSLAEVVPTIFSVLGVPDERNTLPESLWKREAQDCDKVVLFFIDGLGYDQVVKYRYFPFFNILTNMGNLNPITTVFPSTTAAAVTTMHTGLTPQEHGLPEWNVYFEEIDMVIETMPFKQARSKNSDELLEMGIDPEILYSGPTVYEKLKLCGIKSFVLTHKDIAHSAYSSITQRGSEVVPYSRGSDMMIKLIKLLRETRGPAYFYVYWSQVDASGHEFGPHSSEHKSELSMLSHLASSEFLEKLDKKSAENILFLLTADHGQIGVKPGRIICLEDLFNLEEFLKRNSAGNTILPTGCPRDVFLFVREEKLGATLDMLKKRLAGYADVIHTSTAIFKGLFGINKPSEKFLKRIGNILILPYTDYNIWNNGFSKKPSEFRGIHGGLSKREMTIPFVSAKLSQLIK